MILRAFMMVPFVGGLSESSEVGYGDRWVESADALVPLLLRRCMGPTDLSLSDGYNL